MSEFKALPSLFPQIEKGKLLYENRLNEASCVNDFISEGSPTISFPMNCLRLENAMNPELGQAANYLFWCPEIFPSNLIVSWEFRPIREPGLAMFWIAAMGRDGKDLFDPSLAKREGNYRQYHSGDINAYHLSYFRRKQEVERQFHTCNLRKSHGFHLVAQGADPIPEVLNVVEPFKLEVTRCDGWFSFSINELPVLQWFDDGESHGPQLVEGRIGFRQMAPLIAEYSNLKVHSAQRA